MVADPTSAAVRPLRAIAMEVDRAPTITIVAGQDRAISVVVAQMPPGVVLMADLADIAIGNAETRLL
jgi:hypothetical protein